MSLEHKIFRSIKNREKWHNQIEFYLETVNDEYLKGRIISSLQNLSNEFGKWFLKNSHQHHPLYSKIAIKAEENTKWLVWFSEALIKTKIKCINYDVLKEKLRSRNKAQEEGVLILTVANWFASQNTVIEIEPETNVSRKADLKVRFNDLNTDLFVEISQVKDNKFYKSLNTITLHVLDSITKKGLNFSGKIIKEPGTEKLDELLSLISDSIEKCYEQNRFVNLNSLESNGYLEFGFAPRVVKDEYDSWLVKKQFTDSCIAGPLANSNQSLIKTLSRKLDKKAQQLQDDKPGLLVLNLHATYFRHLNLELITQHIEKEMTKWNRRNILGVTLFLDSAMSIKEKQVVNSENSYYIETPLWGMYSRQLLHVANVDYNLSVELRDHLNQTIKSIPEYNTV